MKDFTVIAYSMAILAGCSVAVTGRTFGLWRWLIAKTLALRSEVRAFVSWVLDPPVLCEEPTWEDVYEVAPYSADVVEEDHAPPEEAQCAECGKVVIIAAHHCLSVESQRRFAELTKPRTPRRKRRPKA